MPGISGRGLKQPTVFPSLAADQLILSIDDLKNPEFWVRLRFTPGEFRDLFIQFAQWLSQTEQLDALAELTKSLRLC